MDKQVSYEDWESGKVELKDEEFEPEFGDVIGYSFMYNEIVEERLLIGYKGKETGTRVGTWFYEVMEDIEAKDEQK